MSSARTRDRFGLRVHLLPFLLLGSFAAAVAPAPIQAQLTPADSAAVLLVAASDFERQGQWDVAEAIYELILERYPGTAAAAAARDRLMGPDGVRFDRTSRVELPVFGATYGLWLGVAIPIALAETEPEAYGLGLLLGGPLGLFSARAANNRRLFSEGQARAISWGGVWGTWQGYGWTEVLDIGEEQICNEFGCYESGRNTEEVFTGMILGGLAGIATGAMISRSPVRSGVSSAAQGGSTWGSIYGAMTAELFEPEGEDATIATSLIFGNVGLLAGAALAKKFDVGRPRVRMINLGALVGGLGGVGIDLLVQPDDDATAIAIPLVTSIGGLLVAAFATRDNVRAQGPADDAGPALFGYANGGLTVNAPLPMPTLLPMDDVNGRTAWRPGLRLELFRAKF